MSKLELGKYLPELDQVNKLYVAEMSSAIRAAWQHLIDNHAEGPQAAKKRPVALAFTKMDLVRTVFRATESDEQWQINDEVLQKIAQLGFGEKAPPLQRIDEQSLVSIKKLLESDFADLIAYLKADASTFNIVFTSSFSVVQNKRLGLTELLKAVLPQ